MNSWTSPTGKVWRVLDSMPVGWAFVENGSMWEPRGYKTAANGLSRLHKDHQSAMVRMDGFEAHERCGSPAQLDLSIPKPKATKPKEHRDYSARFNRLAREKFKEKLLQEVQFDLMVCKIEGWKQSEYIDELRDLINSIGAGDG